MARRSKPIMFEVRLTRVAERDLVAILDMIMDASSVNGSKFAATMRRAIGRLDRFPARHPVAPEGVVDGVVIRHLCVGNYRILFSIESKTVTVQGVRHAARLPKGKVEREDDA